MFVWFPLTPGRDVIELHERFLPPGPALELHLARIEGERVAWRQTEQGR